MNETILVTGGLGFIGSNFIHLLDEMRYAGRIVLVDKMTYAAKAENVSGLDGKFSFVRGDIADQAHMTAVFDAYRPALVVNFAAESHVDRSIASSAEFVMSNVVGVQVLLDAARKVGTRRFLQVSTDEVYGDLGDWDYPSKETDVLKPSSPYSASKAAADLLVLAYARTHGMDVVITRCSNNYGPRQYPEKLIPLAIKKLMAGEKVPVYGQGLNIRDWIHVKDHCRGVWMALGKGKRGEVYNFGGGTQIRNIELVKTLVRLTGKPDDSIVFVTDRPGHDGRYAIDYSKAADGLGWYPEILFENGIEETVEWYRKELSL